MRKLTIFEHISLDGVIQSPGGPGEDPENGFTHGGWVAPFSEPAVGELVMRRHSVPFDLLLGRKTYDIWSGYWPQVENKPIGTGINGATKYVATSRPDSLDWGPVENLGTESVAGVRRIKEMDGPDLILWGSSSLTPVLVENALADEILLFVYPVLLGTGKRFYTGQATPRELALVESIPTPSGILINTYKPSGALRTGSF